MTRKDLDTAIDAIMAHVKLQLADWPKEAVRNATYDIEECLLDALEACLRVKDGEE